MGFRIWRKDKTGWSLAFDSVYNTKEEADTHIEELNAAYHDKIKYGELLFYPYREDIELNRNGTIIDNTVSRPKAPKIDFQKWKAKTPRRPQHTRIPSSHTHRAPTR